MPAAPVGASGAADALDCSRFLSGAHRSPVDSPATPTVAGSAAATDETGLAPLP